MQSLLWQQDLFDSRYDVLKAVSPKAPCKPKKTRKKAESGNPLDSLLPWLFPDDFPELQGQIEATQFTWSDIDINKMCRAIVEDALFSLVHHKSNNASRDEAIEWVFSDNVTPFSFIHCCLELEINPLMMREIIFEKLICHRRRLKTTVKKGKATLKEMALYHWLCAQGWLDELLESGETGSAIDGPGEFDPVFIMAHYERVLGMLINTQ